MRQVDLTRTAPPDLDPARTARLTRHLRARLEDFGPGGPEVTAADQSAGVVLARFPGRETSSVLRRLEAECGVRAAECGGLARFSLHPGLAFEDLDYVWGCLFSILE